MKSVFISYDQAFHERIIRTLDRLNCRGFSYFQQVQGRGSKTGEPHYGSHAWPSMCSAIITVVRDEQVDPLLEELHRIDKETERLGLRAFVWDVEKSILEMPATWRYLYLEEKGSLPADDESIARRIYDYAVKKKLERVKEFGIDLTGLYSRFAKNRTN